MTNGKVEERVTPQQLPGVLPPTGWVPPLDTKMTLIGVYNTQSGRWVGLPIQALVEALVQAESKYALDRIDDRDGVQATIPNGSAVGTEVTASITVPSGEVWFLNRLVVTSPADSGAGEIVTVNVRISKWQAPDSRTGTAINDAGRSYWANAQGTTAADTYTIDLPAQGELGEELRLFAGDTITLVATLTTAAAGADLTATLKPYGRKAKRLVE